MKTPRLVQEFLVHTAERVPDKVALICQGKEWRYGELLGGAARLAHGVRERGVQRGDRVVIQLPNTAEVVISIFGTLMADAVFVPVNPSTKIDRLLFILNNCRATGMIGSGRCLNAAVLHRLRAEVPSLRTIVSCGAPIAGSNDSMVKSLAQVCEGMPAIPPPSRAIDVDLACLIYTSGTTGEPKGVMCDHSNVVFASGAIIEYLENQEDDVVIDVLPISFDYGLYQVLMTFRFGGTLVLEESFAYPAEILQRIERYRVTGLPGVPTLFAMLLRMDLSRYSLGSLRYMTNTAAALPVSHVRALRERFPGVKLFCMYGLTETKRTLYLPPAYLDSKCGSVGIPIPGTEAWIEDETGRRLGPGEVGELVVRGRHVMRGYWADPVATSERFRPGPIPGERLCYTGDLFRMDEDGFFYFVARKDDIIKTRGEKVAPREVEDVLHALEGVAEAAVVGLPDPVLGQALKAVIVPARPGLSAAEVLAHCRAHLEDFKVPRWVEFRDSFPRSPSGKVRKEELV